MGKRTCKKCHIEKDLSEFYNVTSHYKNNTKKVYKAHTCKSCYKEQGYLWRRNNPEKVKAVRDKVKITSEQRKDSKLRSIYGITLEQYLILLESQNFVCKCCKRPERMIDFKTRNLKSLAVDHCHTTNRVRGLLCSGCNTALGFVEEDIKTLKNLIIYLENNK